MDEGDLFGNCKTALAPHNWRKGFGRGLAMSLQGGRYGRGLWLRSRLQCQPLPVGSWKHNGPLGLAAPQRAGYSCTQGPFVPILLYDGFPPADIALPLPSRASVNVTSR